MAKKGHKKIEEKFMFIHSFIQTTHLQSSPFYAEILDTPEPLQTTLSTAEGRFVTFQIGISRVNIHQSEVLAIL